MADEEILRITNFIKDDVNEGDLEQYFGDYEIKEGHLYRKTQAGPKWVVRSYHGIQGGEC